jgi:rSAM/selenodomain-associated transferase 2
MPRLSVIIPTLNEGNTIAATVRYMLANGGSDVLEVLVIDARSDDDTVTQASGAGATVLQSPVRSRAAQMNYGAKSASGEVLYFVHADTLPPASFAQDIQAHLAAGYDMGCYRYKFDSPSFLLKINAFFNRFPFLWCQGGDKTFFIQKEKFFALGGYDEYYTIMEEYDFLRRAMPIYRMCTIPKYAIVSARKYVKNSWLQVQLANAKVFGMFKRGETPEKMREVYRKMLKM